jgi:serine/threonine protein kinase
MESATLDLLKAPLPFHLNQYEFFKSLGSGTFGPVFQVRTPKWPNQTFAAKLSRVSKALLDESGEIHDPELTALFCLDSHYIVRVYDYFTHQDYLVLILEYYERGTLADYLAANPEGLPPSLHPGVFKDLVEALKLCHEMQIAHRDVSPSNIFVYDNMHVKLGDFGLALFKSELVHSSSGLPAYAAPEVYQSRPVDPYKIDVFSLGVTIFQLASGRLPFSETDTLKTGEIVWPRNFSHELIELLSVMLATDPADRTPFKVLIQAPYFFTVKDSKRRRPSAGRDGDSPSMGKLPRVLAIGLRGARLGSTDMRFRSHSSFDPEILVVSDKTARAGDDDFADA